MHSWASLTDSWQYNVEYAGDYCQAERHDRDRSLQYAVLLFGLDDSVAAAADTGSAAAGAAQRRQRFDDVHAVGFRPITGRCRPQPAGHRRRLTVRGCDCRCCGRLRPRGTIGGGSGRRRLKERLGSVRIQLRLVDAGRFVAELAVELLLLLLLLLEVVRHGDDVLLIRKIRKCFGCPLTINDPTYGSFSVLATAGGFLCTLNRIRK
jgi:hypothetical protein